MNSLDGQMTNVNGQLGIQPQQMQAQVVNQAPVQQPVVTTQSAQNNQALFTQEQLNSIISGRINPLNQKISELNAQLAQAQQLSQSYLNELNGFKQRDMAVKAGVPTQFVDFAVFEANKLAVNGKSFADAIKEYVASNGSLFGVSQNGSQVQPTSTPIVGQTTQVVANPAQTIQAQQNNNGAVGVVPNAQVVNTQPVVSNAQVVNTQPVVANQNVQPSIGVVPQMNVQYGATSVQTAGNPANTNNIDSQVDAFLKAHNLKK